MTTGGRFFGAVRKRMMTVGGWSVMRRYMNTAGSGVLSNPFVLRLTLCPAKWSGSQSSRFVVVG